MLGFIILGGLLLFARRKKEVKATSETSESEQGTYANEGLNSIYSDPRPTLGGYMPPKGTGIVGEHYEGGVKPVLIASRETAYDECGNCLS